MKITKEGINKSTRVERVNNNHFNLSIQIDDMFFKRPWNEIDCKIIMTTIGESEVIGYAQNKKEFVDEVFDYVKDLQIQI